MFSSHQVSNAQLMCDTSNGGCPKIHKGIVGKNCYECCKLETRLLNAFTRSGTKPLTIGPIAGRWWQLLFPADPKSQKEDGQEYILFAISGVGISPADSVDADQVRQRHYPLPEYPLTVDARKYFRRMKLAQSRVHTVRLSLGPPTAFAQLPPPINLAICHRYDVVLRRVPDIRRNTVLMTDGAGLISKTVMQKIVADYRRYNPDAYVHPNLSAFQGRVGPNKGVWVVWPDHVIARLVRAHADGDVQASSCLLFRRSQQKWNMAETHDAKIEVCRFDPG